MAGGLQACKPSKIFIFFAGVAHESARHQRKRSICEEASLPKFHRVSRITFGAVPKAYALGTAPEPLQRAKNLLQLIERLLRAAAAVVDGVLVCVARLFLLALFFVGAPEPIIGIGIVALQLNRAVERLFGLAILLEPIVAPAQRAVGVWLLLFDGQRLLQGINRLVILAVV